MVQLGDIRIKVIIDDDFDYTLKDWDESLRNEVWSAIDRGQWEPYEILIQRAVPGSWETIESLCGSVHESGMAGTYATVDDIPDSQLRATVTEMMRDLPTV